MKTELNYWTGNYNEHDKSQSIHFRATIDTDEIAQVEEYVRVNTMYKGDGAKETIGCQCRITLKSGLQTCVWEDYNTVYKLWTGMTTPLELRLIKALRKAHGDVSPLSLQGAKAIIEWLDEKDDPVTFDNVGDVVVYLREYSKEEIAEHLKDDANWLSELHIPLNGGRGIVGHW